VCARVAWPSHIRKERKRRQRSKHRETQTSRRQRQQSLGKKKKKKKSKSVGGNTGRDRKGKPEGAKGRAKTQETGWNQDAGR